MGAKYDVDAYEALVKQSVLNCEFWRGTWQDLSASRRTMYVNGTPRLSRVGHVQALTQTAASDHVFSGVVASIVDSVTDSFWAEVMFRPGTADSVYLISQASAGGWFAAWDAANQLVSIETLTAAPAAARAAHTAIGTAPTYKMVHAVLWLDPVGLTGAAWINGLGSAVTFVNTNPPVLCADTQVRVGGVDGLAAQTCIARVWQGTPTNADAALLYAASRNLVTP